MLVHIGDLPQSERIPYAIGGYLAVCQDTGVLMRRSDGRRRAGRNSKYYLRFPDAYKNPPTVGCTAANDDEAIRKLQPKLDETLAAMPESEATNE